jgi:hypothetical protein
MSDAEIYRECPFRSDDPVGTVSCACQGMPVIFWCSHEQVASYVMLTKNRLANSWANLYDGQQVELPTTVLKDCMTCEFRPACKDPLPPLASQLLSFGSAVLRFMRAGLPKVTRTDYDQRIGSCLACPRLSPEGRCAHCGCWVSEKALWQTEDCPENRWTKETDDAPDPRAEVSTVGSQDDSQDLLELSALG